MDNDILFLVKSLSQALNLFVDFVFPIIMAWWWVILAPLSIPIIISSWLWWRQTIHFKKRKYVLLEIKLPSEILKPMRAMENVFSSLLVVIFDHSTNIFREKWIEGENTFMPTLSFEIAGLNGETHFFIRTETAYRQTVESILYSEYPDIEIVEAKDYTDMIPQNIPTPEWRLECREFVLSRPDAYPIKTYVKFETEAERKEEKRIDPMTRLLEGLSSLQQGEQVWFQVLVSPAKPDWVDEGKALRDKLVHRPGAKQQKPMALEAAEILLKGMQEKKEEQKEIIPSEMKLTPGEREILKEIERKISKTGLNTSIRIIYLGKKEVFFKPRLGLPISFLSSFGTGSLNRFAVFKPTTTKVKSPLLWFWDKQRAFLKKRAAFKNYKMRVNPMFPKRGGTSVLNLEELASIFHFPGRTVAPAPFMSRLESKKGEAPLGLPIG